MSIFTGDRAEFERMLLVGNLKRPHTAAMVKRAEPYMGGMDSRTRDVFLEAAIDFAWEHRLSYNPQYEALPMFWSRCLKAAALTRGKWLVDVATSLPGVYEKRWVLGTLLGEHR